MCCFRVGPRRRSRRRDKKPTRAGNDSRHFQRRNVIESRSVTQPPPPPHLPPSFPPSSYSVGVQGPDRRPTTRDSQGRRRKKATPASRQGRLTDGRHHPATPPTPPTPPPPSTTFDRWFNTRAPRSFDQRAPSDRIRYLLFIFLPRLQRDYWLLPGYFRLLPDLPEFFFSSIKGHPAAKGIQFFSDFDLGFHELTGFYRVILVCYRILSSFFLFNKRAPQSLRYPLISLILY